MTEMTQEEVVAELYNWERSEYDISDLIHIYFQNTGLRDWCDIYTEGMDLWEIMFDEELEEYSAITDILSGIAAQANHGAWLAMASALGWDARYLEIALYDWQRGISEGPYETKTITLDELKQRYEDALSRKDKTLEERGES